jgi:hypothetical protein
MKQATRLLFLALTFALAGCLPVSQNPLSSPDTAVADARLAGVWYGKSGDDTIFLHFVAGKGAQMDVVEVDHQISGDAHTNLYTMFPSHLDSTRYMNIREKKGASKAYYLARYQISASGALSIWLMSEKAASKAINNDKLAGKISVKDTGGSGTERDVTITSGTERLAAFVKKSDPEILFAEKFGTFRKLTLPLLDTAPEPKIPAKNTNSKTSAKIKKKPSN